MLLLLALAWRGEAQQLLEVSGAQPPKGWVEERTKFAAAERARFPKLAARLPVAIHLNAGFVEAAQKRRSIEAIDDCGDGLCGVAAGEVGDQWEVAIVRAMYTPADPPRVERDAYAVALLGRFHGEDLDRWARDVADTRLESDPLVAIPVRASRIRFADPKHEVPFAAIAARIGNEPDPAWLAHLRSIAPEPVRVPRGFLHGATFSLVNRIERSTISDASKHELERLRGIGYDAIALLPFAFQRGIHASELHRLSSSPASETDLAMTLAAHRAHAHGMRVLLKPQIWEGTTGDPTQIAPDDWPAWFASYRSFLLHEALLARAIGAAWLCVGVELTKSESRPEWRNLIAEVRRLYHGGLVYAANFDAFERTPLWTLVDAIGVDAYFPLAPNADAGDEQLRAGAAAAVARLESVGRKYGKPVILTELGYAANDAPWIEPWSERRGSSAGGPRQQARAFEAMLSALHGTRNVAGFFIWKYQSDGSERDAEGFFPKGKPAEEVIRKSLH